MKKYRLTFEYSYTHDYQVEFIAENIEEAETIAQKEYIDKFTSPITGTIELVELGIFKIIYKQNETNP